MVRAFSATRRHFLSSTSLACFGVGALSNDAESQETVCDGSDDKKFAYQSQQLPEPKIVLPTDSLPVPQGPRKRVAAITTTYFKYSHADDIITKFIEGYGVVGRTFLPHCDVVSMYVEQFPETDIGRGMAARYGIPLFDTPSEALTMDGSDLAVDAVLLIGEHGNYPSNEKGQKLYPRRRLFEEIVKVFRKSEKSVPVYNDKHFSYSWKHAEWMYEQSRELDFPMMAGSSVPVTWRLPALEFRSGAPLASTLGVGFSGVESYGFHTLEVMQTVAERRPGGETGVKSVQALKGEQAWAAARAGHWDYRLLRSAMNCVPNSRQAVQSLDQLQKADPDAVVFLVDYCDGFQAASYLSRGMINEFAFSARMNGDAAIQSAWCYLPKPQRDHFSFLCNHIEVMFRTGVPSYPVERTYLVTGMLASLIDSYNQKGKRMETPHLRSIHYKPYLKGERRG